MRELLVENSSEAPDFNRSQVKLGNAKKIIELFNESDVNGCGFISFELCPERRLNVDLLFKLKPKFCSVTWLGECDNQEVEQTPALSLIQQLHEQGFHTLLHLAGRNLDKRSVVEILNKVRGIGVRNILALQGGT